MAISALPPTVRSPTLEQKVAFLRTAIAAKDRGACEAIETHFAWVFLGERFVFKLRKPMRHGCMDYRTLRQRRRGCRGEFVLNRRLAPGVYLQVVPLRLSGSGQLRLGRGSGRVVDYLVKMRRLPAAQMLDGVLTRRALRADEEAALLARLGGFFRSVPRRPLPAKLYMARMRRQMQVNRRSLLVHAGEYRELIERVVRLQGETLRLLHAELARRAACLVDGHGDLRPEHVCLRRPVAVIDCIEFDPELRRMDPLEEVAFLALEAARLGRARAAWAMLRRYRNEYHLEASDELLQLYASLRALTRARLSAWHIGDPQFPDARPWRRRTGSYLRDAERLVTAALRRLRAMPSATAASPSAAG